MTVVEAGRKGGRAGTGEAKAKGIKALNASLSPEERIERARQGGKAYAALSPERRRKVALKGWITRRRAALARWAKREEK